MGTKTIIAILLLGLPILNSCNGNKPSTPVVDNQTVSQDTVAQARSQFYFNGDFTYYADAAIFKDCITGNSLPVAQTSEYLKLEKMYTDLKPEQQEAVNCAVMGYLITKNPSEEGPNLQLVVTGIISMEKNSNCNTANNITNCNYINYSPNEKEAKSKTTLTFNKDYTFQCTTYQISPMQLLNNNQGKWHRTDLDNIVLLVNGDILYEGVIDFSNMNLILQNDNQKEIIFKKE